MPAMTNKSLNEATHPARQRKDASHAVAAPTTQIQSAKLRRDGTQLRPAAQLAGFLDWLEGNSIDRFDLALIRFGPDTLAGKFIPGSANLDRAGLENSLSWLRFENSRTAGVYFRPARGHSWPLVFLDDVTSAEANRFADNYSAALIETSPNRFHVWLAVDQALSEHDRYRLQGNIARQVGADMGSISGEHWGRLPGFKNRKPGKDNWVNLRKLSVAQPFPTSPFPDMREESMDAQTPIHPCVAQQNANQDESAVEWKFVRSALEAGIPPGIVNQKLLERCAARRGSDAKRYAEQTMRKACAKCSVAFR